MRLGPIEDRHLAAEAARQKQRCWCGHTNHDHGEYALDPLTILPAACSIQGCGCARYRHHRRLFRRGS